MPRLARLATGLDVNVRFSAPTAFEFTDEVAIFDLLGLPLLHGWVVDGADPAADVMRGLSYNQAVELAVSGGEGGDSAPAPPPARPTPTPPNSRATPAGSGAPPSDAATPTVAARAPGLDSLSPADLADALETGLRVGRADEDAADEGAVRALVAGVMDRVARAAAADAPPPVDRPSLARSFLARTAAQFTPAGLVALSTALPPGTVGVLFRNNHFATVASPPTGGALHALVTDVGYAKAGDIVWERLDRVDGDTALVGGDFQEAAAARVADGDAAAAASLAAAGPGGHDADYQLALRLQAEEEERARAAREARRAAEGERAPGQGVRPAARPASGGRPPPLEKEKSCCVM